MYLIDTNVLSELRKQQRCDANVRLWFRDIDPELTFISPIVIAEIDRGIQLVERKDQVQGRLLRKWADKVYAEFERRCIPIDLAIARVFAMLHVPDPKPERDAWIAATALNQGLSVVTRNETDFRAMNVRIINPWRDGPIS